jgi:hypothetical protein
MIMSTAHEDLCTYMLVSRAIILRLRNVSGENCIGSPSTRFVFSNFLPKIMAFMRYVEKCGTAGQATDDSIMQQVRCWIPNATHIHSEYLILISFPQQQCLRECASVLHLYLHYLSC